MSEDPTPAEASGLRREIQNRSQQNNDDWQCPNCKIVFGEKSEQCWLECAICLNHYDTDCIKMPKKHWQSISARNDIQWLCTDCMKRYLPNPSKGLQLRREINQTDDHTEGELEILMQLKKLEKLQETLKYKITDLDKSLDSKIAKLTTDIPQRVSVSISDKLDNVPKRIESNITKWSDLFKTTAMESNKENLESFKIALNEQSKSDTEREHRNRSMILFKVREGKSESHEGRRNEDGKFVADFMKEIGFNDIEIDRFDRLGKYDPEKAKDGKARPIRVRLESKQKKQEITGSLKNLARAPEIFRKVSVKHDLSQSERDLVKQKIEEAKNKTNESDEFAYLVRGPPWNLKLIQVAKKAM